MIVVSNRLPLTLSRVGDRLEIHASSGGLVTALVPILREFGGCWVGWPGTTAGESELCRFLNGWSARQNCSLHPVILSKTDKELFYNGCSNQVIWPLFHGLPSRCRFDSAYWDCYRSGNEKFASTVEDIARTGDFIWVQDYQLMLVGQSLRDRGCRNRIAYFHHIPFPPPDVFETLPWRCELLAGLMHYDVIGFQTSRDMRNFVGSVRRCLPESRIGHFGKNLLIRTNVLSARVGRYPVSIDFDEFAAHASSTTRSTAAAITQSADGMKVILGVDRLDYTKGILQRLAGFQTFLAAHPEWHQRVVMFQVVIPSREEIAEYSQLKQEIEIAVSRINGEHGTAAWVPVHYFHRSIPKDELIGFYRAAAIALVTPLRDGMNLVAKEFCAARTDNRGVLVLSEFAGAAEELGTGALLVNPNDTDTIASTLHAALTMSDFEQEQRMRAMRATIRAHDVFHWACSFARDAGGFAAEWSSAATRVAGA
jgi:trehalose 6-phosphate synthase